MGERLDQHAVQTAGDDANDLSLNDLETLPEGEIDEFDDAFQPRPLWQWLVAGVVVFGLFGVLALAFAGLLQSLVTPAPASAVFEGQTAAADASGPVQPKPAAPDASATGNAVDADAELEALLAAEAQSAQQAGGPVPGAQPAPQSGAQPGAQQGSTATPAEAKAASPTATAAAAVSGPHIVLLLADAGTNPALTDQAIRRLPAEVAIGFSPYADQLKQQAGKARAAGHEIWLGVPMEPLRYPKVDPGPQALLLSLTPEQNLARLQSVLGRVDGEVGLYTMMGSAFTAEEAALAPVIKAAADRKLGFLDVRSTGKTKSRAVAGRLGVPVLLNDRFVGDPATSQAIERQLAELERLARSNGRAVGIIQPSPLALDRLSRWIPTLADKNIRLAHATAALTAKQR